MRGTPEDKEYYEALERKIIKEATNNGVSFEQAALIAAEIRNEGLKDFAFCNMLESKLIKLRNLK